MKKVYAILSECLPIILRFNLWSSNDKLFLNISFSIFLNKIMHFYKPKERRYSSTSE